MVERFVIAGPDGVRDVMGREGSDPAGVTSLAAPGVYVIGYRSRPKSVELDAAKFEQYLREEGLERIIDQRKQAGRSNAPASKSSRAARRRSSDDLAGRAVSQRSALGLRLELIAEQLTPGKPATFRLLYEGPPLEGALVVAISKDAPMEKLTARTNKAGRVSFTLPTAGCGSSRPCTWCRRRAKRPRNGKACGRRRRSSCRRRRRGRGHDAMRGARKSDAGARRSDPALPAARASR